MVRACLFRDKMSADSDARARTVRYRAGEVDSVKTRVCRVRARVRRARVRARARVRRGRARDLSATERLLRVAQGCRASGSRRDQIYPDPAKRASRREKPTPTKLRPPARLPRESLTPSSESSASAAPSAATRP
eukprot:31398-Pelagococcus_subviridis.AAC.19